MVLRWNRRAKDEGNNGRYGIAADGTKEKQRGVWPRCFCGFIRYWNILEVVFVGACVLTAF